MRSDYRCGKTPLRLHGWDSLEMQVLASYLGFWRSPLPPLHFHLSWRDCRPSPAKPSLCTRATRSGEGVPATPRPLGSPHPASQQTYLQARSPRALVTLHSLPVGFSPMLPTTVSRTYCLQETVTFRARQARRWHPL